MNVLKLLQSKNRCLEKFLKYSEEFLSQAEMGDLSSINEFQNRREGALKAVLLFDRKITEIIEELSSDEKTNTLIESVKQALAAKDELIQSILITDQKIIAKIEEEKERLLKELSTSDKSMQMVKKFKSKWISESGEKLDGKL